MAHIPFIYAFTYGVIKIIMHLVTLPISRKQYGVSKQNIGDYFPSKNDVDGLDNLFDGTVSHATTDRTTKRLIEVSISEAARRLGTSERTIWRRIGRHELKSRTKGNKRLVKIPVYVPDAVIDSEGHTTMSEVPPQTNALVDLGALLKDLQSANYRIGFLQAQLENHQDQVKLLPDLQSQAAKAATLEKQLAERETELTSIKASWWYRIWSWLSGRTSVG